MSWKDFLFDNPDANEKAQDTSKNVKPETTTQKQDASQVITQPQSFIQQPIGSTINSVGIINQEIYSAFDSVLDSIEFTEPNFLSVKKASVPLKMAIPDDNSRFVAAFNVVKATSPKLTKKVMIDSINKCIERMGLEHEESVNEFNERVNIEITARQKAIDDKKLEIENNSKKILELQELNANLSSNINTIGGEMQSKQIELDIQKKNFEATYDAYMTNLNSDKTKIETLIIE